jgi:Skp family chaperone for outer membrane proteins
MKKYNVSLLLAPALLSLCAAISLGQTPTPKPGATTPAATNSASTNLPKPRIAFVNTAAFMEGIGELKIIYDKIRADFAPRENELASMKTAIDAKQDQINKNSGKMTPAQIQKLQGEIEQLRKEGQRKLEDYQVDLQKREEALTGATYGKINEHLNKYVAEKGITIVFSSLQVAENNLIVYMDPKADITQDFITSYNKANPAAAPQAANAPASGTTPKKP